MNIITYLKSKYIDVESFISDGGRELCVIYVNPLNYFSTRKNREIMESTYYRTDGIFLTTTLRALVLRGGNIKRQSFDMTSLAPKVLAYCEEQGLSLYIAGGSEEDIRSFVSIIENMFPKLNILGYCHGYLGEEEIKKKVLQSGADATLLGLGNVKQERLAAQLFGERSALYFTCGAFISQTAMGIGGAYYPAWVDRFNLRWFYRCIHEEGIIYRLMVRYPIFLIVFLKDYIVWSFFDGFD